MVFGGGTSYPFSNVSSARGGILSQGLLLDPLLLSSGLGVRGIFLALRLLSPPPPPTPSTLLPTLCQLSSLPLELLLVPEGLRATRPTVGLRNLEESLLFGWGEERGDSTDFGFGAVGLGGAGGSGDEVRDRSVITGELPGGSDLRFKLPSLPFLWRES